MKKNCLKLMFLILVIFGSISLVACNGIFGHKDKGGQEITQVEPAERVITQIEISENGDIEIYFLDGSSSNVGRAKLDELINGNNEINGKVIYDLYKEKCEYYGTEETFYEKVLRGELSEIVSYAVRLDSNGGTFPEGVAELRQVGNGKTLQLPELTRTGHQFLGWYIGEEAVDGTTVVARPLTLVAQWKKLSYKVEFVDYDGALLKADFVEYGDKATPPADPNRNGYTFGGWDKDFSKITDNIIIIAVYNILTYTISYNTDSDESIAPVAVPYGQIAEAPEIPKKAGYWFLGWFLANEDGEEVEYKFDIAFDCDVQLTAHWTEITSIVDVEGLIAIGNDLSARNCLEKDINLQGAEWSPLGTFTGILEGNGHKIYNFMMTQSSASVGFFKENNGTINNLTFSDVVVTNAYNGVSDTGIVVAVNNGTLNGVNVLESTLSRSFTTYNCNAVIIGGLVAQNNGSIENSKLNINVNVNATSGPGDYYRVFSFSRFGGIVGLNYGVIKKADVIINLSYNGIASSASNLDSCVGGAIGINANIVENINITAIMDIQRTGLVGNAPRSIMHIGTVAGYNRDGGVVRNCISKGNMISKNTGNNLTGCNINIGGVVGYNDPTSSVFICLSEMSINYSASETNGALGGIVGVNATNTTVSNCKFTGEITATSLSNLGGIVGTQNGGVVSYSVFNGKISNSVVNNSGGIVGHLESGGVINKCINDGTVEVAGSPQYIVGSSAGSITKCYRTENAVVVDDGVVTDGTQGDTAIIKEVTELYTTEFIFDTLLFDSDVWVVTENGLMLKFFEENE